MFEQLYLVIGIYFIYVAVGICTKHTESFLHYRTHPVDWNAKKPVSGMAMTLSAVTPGIVLAVFVTVSLAVITVVLGKCIFNYLTQNTFL